MAPIDKVVRPEDELAEFGQPRTFGSQELKLETQRIQADNNAFELLRRAQAAQRGDMTPSQGIASALLAAIPTLGGYLIGKSVGAPKLPEGAYFKGMSPEAFGELYGSSGGAAGGLAGMKVGEQLQEKYKKSILEDPKLLAEQAQAEMYRSKDLLNDQNALVQADLTNQAAGERQAQAQLAEERQIRLRGEEDRKTAAAKTSSNGLTTEQQAAYGKVATGTATEEDYAILPPTAIKSATEAARARIAASEAARRGQAYKDTLSFAENNQTVILDPSGRDPKLNTARAEIRGNKAVAMDAIQQLENSYDKTSGAFLGLDAVKEAALAAHVYSASRLLAGTGASLTGNEGAIIYAMSAPNVTVDGVWSYVKRYIQSSGDPAAATKEINKALASAFEKKMNAYGQGFVEFHPDKVSSTQNIVNTQNGTGKFSEEAIQKKMAEIAAREAANGNR